MGHMIGIALLVVGIVDLLLGIFVLPRTTRNPGSAGVITLIMAISGLSFTIAGVLVLTGIIRVP